MKKRKKLSGARRMVALGYKQSQIWMSPEHRERIEAAAINRALTVSGFILLAALRYAEETLRQ